MPRKAFAQMDIDQKDEALSQLQTRIQQIRGELRAARGARTNGEKRAREEEAEAKVVEIRREMRELGLNDVEGAQ